MKKFLFSFHGRQAGAIGITYDIQQQYEANSLNEAVSMLWIDYEPTFRLKLNGKPFKCESHHFIKINYEGLKGKRK